MTSVTWIFVKKALSWGCGIVCATSFVRAIRYSFDDDIDIDDVSDDIVKTMIA